VPRLQSKGSTLEYHRALLARRSASSHHDLIERPQQKALHDDWIVKRRRRQTDRAVIRV
jgi:hypothetical protein